MKKCRPEEPEEEFDVWEEYNPYGEMDLDSFGNCYSDADPGL